MPADEDVAAAAEAAETNPDLQKLHEEKRDLHDPASPTTVRDSERKEEDTRYQPVIVKRIDAAARHPDDTLLHAIEEGLEQAYRPTVSLLLASIAAGLILGFTVMAVAVANTFAQELGVSELAARLMMAVVYPLGFVVVVLSGQQLFTEHTATAVYPLLDGRSSLKRLLRLWSLVLGGNLVGAVCAALLLTGAEPVIHAKAGYIAIGHHLVGWGFGTLLISGILAGWLMALGGWLLLSTPPTVAQIVLIYFVTFLIGVGGLHHSIAGSVEIFVAKLMAWHEFGWGPTLYFIAVAVLGNAIGGAVFVAALNYAHIRKTQSV